jgi:predicted amidohydrolase
MQPVKIALCQITPEYDKSANVKRAAEMVATASDKGAGLIVLPEVFYFPFDLLRLRNIAGDEHEILERFQLLAQRYSVHICTGSMVFMRGTKRFNSSHLIGPDGEVLLSYSKCHLFDAELDGVRVKESMVFSQGEKYAYTQTSLGMVGILICYDIRFPEMARHLALQGTELLLVPAVFNQVTGPAHWECFMRTRAVENQLFIAAVSQGRSPDASVYTSYGHSMVVDPWGDALTEAGEDETIVYADLDPKRLADVRRRMPLLQHRREKLYTSSNLE